MPQLANIFTTPVAPSFKGGLKEYLRASGAEVVHIHWPPPLTERYQGGRTRYVHEVDPVDEPVERFFGRLLILRDRLMQLEAQVAAHPHIAPDEGDGMGSYIRRCYGTLTTFNVLFRERSDYFSSSR